MRISVRNAVDSSSEAIEKHVVAGRTVVRLAQGQRLEIVDEKTGQVPANLRARRGGKDGEDLILESNGEIVEIEGFFAMAGEGEEAVVVEFPGGEVAEITPASAEFAGDWAGSAAFAMTDSVSSLSTMAQGAGAAGASSAGASSAGAAAGGAAAGASSLGWGWIALGGLAAAGVGAAIADDDDDSPAPAPQPEPQPEPTFALSASADEVDEGTDVVFTLSTTNVAPGTQYEYVITGISAADVEGGKLSGTVTIGADGKALIPVSLLEDLKTEGVETLKITIAGQTYEVTVNDTSLTPEPTFELSASAESVDEGSDVVFTLTTTNVAPGTQFEYQLSGVSAADIVGGRLTGTVTIDANGQALIPVSLLEDLKTEGVETLKITIAGQTYEVTVNDTSLTPEPTFALSASAESVDEGADVVFTLTTTNVAPGTQFEYQISGVSAADVAGGKLTGTVTIDANGRALIPVSLLADLKTEGVETLKITIAGQTYEVTVNDTSLTPAFVLTEGLDDIKGEAVDDVVYGNAATYNAGDKIDGGAGHDTLNLSLASGTKAESVTVKSVETVNITTTAGEDAVELTMTNYEGVEQINVHDARSDLSIVDQQDLWDVSITDTDRNVSLDYDSQVVAGKSDALNVAVREFTGNLAIDPGVEVLDLTINDGVHEDSAFGLQARGVTEVKLSGGVAGQEVAIDLDINHPGEDHDHAAGATFDARDFVGDLTLTNLEGGERTYSAALEITQGLEAGQTATVTIGGKLTITVEAGEGGMTAAAVANALAEQLNIALGTSGDVQKGPVPVPGSNGAYAVIIENLHAPGGEGSTVEIAGTAVEIKTDFDYGGNLTDEALNKAKNSEVSKLVLGDGNDTVIVTAGDITNEDSYDLGAGENTLIVGEGSVYGEVSFGNGGSALIVGDQHDGNGKSEISGNASVSFGEGANVLVVEGSVTGQATVSFGAGENQMYVGDNIDGLAQVQFNGGSNTLVVEGEIAQFAEISFNGDGDNTLETLEGGIAHGAHVTFGNGDNTLTVGENIASGANIEFGTGSNTVSVSGDIASGFELDEETKAAGPTLTFNDVAGSKNELTVGGAILGWGAFEAGNIGITFGDGDNVVAVSGADVDGAGMRHATLTFGAGENELTVHHDVQVSTITFGDGGNTVDLKGDVRRSDLSFGDGDDNLSIGAELHLSTIDLGNGDNTLTVNGTVTQGSVVTFGEGNDTLNLGDGEAFTQLSGGERMTIVDMGDGDDIVTVVRGDNSASENSEVLVRSGAALHGGAGNDTLTVRAVDDVVLAARTEKQVVTLTLEGTYKVGDVLSVTIGEDAEPITYTVNASDIVQGNADATLANIAEALFDAMNGATPSMSLDQTGNVITLTGEKGDADVDVSVEVIHADGSYSEGDGQITKTTDFANAEISGFETLELVAVDPVGEGEGQNDDDGDFSPAHFTADFDLITGVEQIKLTSEVELRRETLSAEDIVNGVYEKRTARDPAEFNLLNLTAELSENITVSAHEASATGDRQVERIVIAREDSDHVIGQTITVSIGGKEYVYTVTEDDLLAGDAIAAANSIAANLAELLAEGEHGFAVKVDGNVITLIGSEDEDVEVLLNSQSEDDLQYTVQCAAAADDGVEDVIIRAQLARDGENDTLALTLDGPGNFDVALTAVGEDSTGEDSAYEHLVINVNDENSHTIDTGYEDDQNRAFAGGSITLRGGVLGAAIVIDDVMAKTVTVVDSEADVTVNFDGEADAGAVRGEEGYSFSVTTLGGDDVVDMSGVTLTRHATIDLGEGTDRLIIGNGRFEAEDATSGSPSMVKDRMFEGVRNVEILEIAAGTEVLGGVDHAADGHEGEDGIFFDLHAFNAGFEQLVLGEDTHIRLEVGDQFNRDLDVQIGKHSALDMTVSNQDAISIEAENHVTVTADLKDGSAGDFSLEGGDCNTVEVTSRGSGALAIEIGAHGEVGVDQYGEGNVAVTSGANSSIDVNQYGLGDVTVEAGGGSGIAVSFIGDAGEDSEANVSVSLTSSLDNEVTLSGLTSEQNVAVDIDVAGEYTFIADLEDAYCTLGIDPDLFGGKETIEKASTNLIVQGEGGIDTLTVHTAESEEPTVVGIVTSDSWAVGDGESHTIDMTIDASAASATAFVGIYAAEEKNADLEIVGSTSSRNVIIGGDGSDIIKGGSKDDILIGDAVRTWDNVTVITFEETYAHGTGLEFTIGGEDFVFGAFDMGDGQVSGAEFARALAEYINSGEDSEDAVLGPGWFGTPNSAVLDQITAEWNGNTLVLFGADAEQPVEVQVKRVTYGGDVPLDYSVEEDVTSAYVWERATWSKLASDTLEGGEGNDIYMIAGSQYESMDTIVGMNFGGVGEAEGADRIVLGAVPANLVVGNVLDVEGAVEDITLPPSEDLLIVNGGLVDHNSLNDDLDLETALEALFQGAGVFDAEGSSDTRTYAAGLFSHQGETYLIAVGGVAESKFGADDYIVKLENFSGTLDSSDLVMWSTLSLVP